MTITIQLTEIPSNETVTNRVFTLPKNGGNLGSAFDCTIQLPDRSEQVAAIHGRFIPHKQTMTLEAINGCKISINGLPLASGRAVTIDDGTIIQVADYILLVSQTGQDEYPSSVDEEASALKSDSHFSLGDFQTDDSDDDLVMKNNKQTTNSYDNLSQNLSQEQAPHFAASGVFSDDPFDEDPFNDEELSLNVEPEQESIDISASIEEGTIEQMERQDHRDDFNYDEQAFQPATLQGRKLQTQDNDRTNNPQLDKLVSLLGSQLVSANDQQSNLFKALDKTLSSFLDEFSPLHLEEIYNDFGTPMFIAKEKQYWRMYRKSFNRRVDKGDYHRLFKALLLENMQNQSIAEDD